MLDEDVAFLLDDEDTGFYELDEAGLAELEVDGFELEEVVSCPLVCPELEVDGFLLEDDDGLALEVVTGTGTHPSTPSNQHRGSKMLSHFLELEGVDFLLDEEAAGFLLEDEAGFPPS